METGVNQLGFISSYSPIGDDEHGHFVAAPEFYGMLAFAQGIDGELLETQLRASNSNLEGYATLRRDKHCGLGGRLSQIWEYHSWFKWLLLCAPLTRFSALANDRRQTKRIRTR